MPAGGEGRGPRWKYAWKNKVPANQKSVEYAPKRLVNRPTVVITEEGLTMQIELPEHTIIIKQKKK